MQTPAFFYRIQNSQLQAWARREKLLLTLLLLLAAGLRLAGLNNLSPPGPSHDEVANWLIDRRILSGEHALYFTEAYGHEAGFHYLQAGFLSLLGDNVLALRLPAAFAGLLLLAVTYALGRRMVAAGGLPRSAGGISLPLAATALLAVLFWSIFFSRQGLRAISLPLLAGMSAIFWWRGWQWNRSRDFLLGGLLAGLSLHTYMAARAVPLFFLAFIGYLMLFHRQQFRERWQGMLLFLLAMGFVAAPLALYLLGNPGSEFRISEIDAPLRAMMNGDFGPVLGNALKVLWVFGVRGDSLWRHNVAGSPALEPLGALCFYGGLALALWRWRKPAYAFLLGWLLIAAAPSIATSDAPSTIRMINMLPVLALFPMVFLAELDTNPVAIPILRRPGAVAFVTLTIISLNLLVAVLGIFWRWPQNEEVQFVWQAALTEGAAYLDAHPELESAAVAGWTPESMDNPTMRLLLSRPDTRLLHFAPEQSLAIPGNFPTAILQPATLPLAAPLRDRLMQWGTAVETLDQVTVYSLLSAPAISPQTRMEMRFGDELMLLGVDQVEMWTFVSYWQVVQPGREERRLFLHALDSSGEIAAQDDGLHAPAQFWEVGDLLVQFHRLDLPAGADVELRLGVYDPVTLQRLETAEGADGVILMFDE